MPSVRQKGYHWSGVWTKYRRLVTVSKRVGKASRTFVIDMYTQRFCELPVTKAATGRLGWRQSVSAEYTAFTHLGRKGICCFGLLQKQAYLPGGTKSKSIQFGNAVRPSMIRDVERQSALLNRSLFARMGWLSRPSKQLSSDGLDRDSSVRITHIHTSGHASVRIWLRCKGVSYSVVVPVHLDDVASFVGHFRNCEPSRMGRGGLSRRTRLVSKRFPFCRSSAD